MAELITQYTDAKNVVHNVQHITLTTEDNSEKEQLAEEIVRVLTQKQNYTIDK